MTLPEKCYDEMAEDSCNMSFASYDTQLVAQDDKAPFQQADVTYVLVSNNPDGQMVHQLIQVPPDSVFVVSDVQTEDVTYLPLQDDGRDGGEIGPPEIHGAVHYRDDSPPTDIPSHPSDRRPDKSRPGEIPSITDIIPSIPEMSENTNSHRLQPGEHNTEHYTGAACSSCQQYFESSELLREHNLAKHGDLFTCGVCFRGFGSAKYLKSHVTTHQPKQFKCEQCGDMFTRAASLSSHRKRMHDRAGKCGGDHECHKCSDCSAVFRTSSSLARHECQKTRSFMCPYCEASFTRHTGLLNHMLNKENRRKFPCSICKKSFNTQAQLRRHERVHVPESWFKCDACGSKYASASGLRSHNIQKHNGHTPNSLPPKRRLTSDQLRKRRQHRQYRDECSQTTAISSTSTNPQDSLMTHSEESA